MIKAIKANFLKGGEFPKGGEKFLGISHPGGEIGGGGGKILGHLKEQVDVEKEYYYS
jgi:hypothetical protein